MIDINNITNNTATLDFIWGNTYVAVPLDLGTNKQVMAGFERMEKGPSANQYYAYGQYLVSENIDMEKGLKYIQKLTHSDNARFFTVYQEALALSKMGKHGEAIKVAEKSLKMSEEAENAAFIGLNKNLIKASKEKM